MRPLLLFLTLLCFVFCSNKPIQTVPVGEYASSALLVQFSDAKVEMIWVVSELFKANSMTEKHANLIQTAQSSFIGLLVYEALAYKGINPFLLYLIADKAVSSLIEALATFEAKKDFNRVEIAYNEGFRSSLDLRLCQGFNLIAYSTLPPEVRKVYLALIKIQSAAIDEMKSKVNVYVALNQKYNGTNRIETLFAHLLDELDIEQYSALPPFKQWGHKIHEAEKNYLLPLIEFFETKKVSDKECPRFLVILARLPYVYENVYLECEIGSRARESALILYHDMKVTENYFRFRARLKTHSLQQQLQKFNWSTYHIIQHSYSLLMITRHAIDLQWAKYPSKPHRVTIFGISTGIDYLVDLMINLKSSFEKPMTGKDLRPAITRVLQAYGMCVEILGKFSDPYLSETSRKAFSDSLRFPKTLEHGFSSRMFGMFDILESQLSLIYPSAALLAVSLFRYLEVCRSLAFLGDKLIKGMGKMEIYTTAVCHTHYMESQEYLDTAIFEDVIDLTKMTMKEAQLVAKNVVAAFSFLINKKPAQKELSPHFIQYIRNQFKNNPKNPLWQNVSYGAKTEFAQLEKEERIEAEKKKKEEDEASQKVKVESPKSRLKKTVTKPKKKRGQFRAEAKPKASKVIEEVEPVKIMSTEQNALVPAIPNVDILDHEIENTVEKRLKPCLKPIDSLPAIRLPRPSEFVSAILRPMDLIRAGITIKVPDCARPFRRKSSPLSEHDPTHHIETASLLGYQSGSNVDSRDYLMAHILIGQRIWVKVLKPLFNVLGPLEKKYHLINLFKTSTEDFKNALLSMRPKKLGSILQEAGIQDLTFLFKCMDYYHKRMLIAHPEIPSSNADRESVISRHLTVLEMNHVLDTVSMCRMRRKLECPSVLYVKSISTLSGRPSNLLKPETTEIALSAIWVKTVYQDDKIEFIRRNNAHMEVTDTVYQSYIDYIFHDHPDYTFLVKL